MTTDTIWTPPRDVIRWHGRAAVTKYYEDDDLTPITSAGIYGPRRATPYEAIEGDNLLLTAGAGLVLDLFGGLGGTAVNAANGRMCVGDSATAAAIGQTDLQAATNKVRQVIDAAPSRTGNQIQYVCTFAAGTATFTWNECGLANSASGATLTNRLVQAFGAKGAGVQWILTFTVTIA